MADAGTRSRLLDATLTVVASEGVRAVTHRRVAEQAGVSLGTTTYHFGSRDDMLAAAYQRYLDDLAVALEEHFPADVGDIDSLIEALVELLRREFDDRRLVLVEYELYLAAARDATLAGRLVAWERRVTADLVAALEQLGVARPVEAARTAVNVVRGLELERLTRDLSDEDVRRRLSIVLRAVCDPVPVDRQRAMR